MSEESIAIRCAQDANGHLKFVAKDMVSLCGVDYCRKLTRALGEDRLTKMSIDGHSVVVVGIKEFIDLVLRFSKQIADSNVIAVPVNDKSHEKIQSDIEVEELCLPLKETKSVEVSSGISEQQIHDIAKKELKDFYYKQISTEFNDAINTLHLEINELQSEIKRLKGEKIKQTIFSDEPDEIYDDPDTAQLIEKTESECLPAISDETSQAETEIDTESVYQYIRENAIFGDLYENWTGWSRNFVEAVFGDKDERIEYFKDINNEVFARFCKLWKRAPYDNKGGFLKYISRQNIKESPDKRELCVLEAEEFITRCLNMGLDPHYFINHNALPKEYNVQNVQKEGM